MLDGLPIHDSCPGGFCVEGTTPLICSNGLGHNWVKNGRGTHFTFTRGDAKPGPGDCLSLIGQECTVCGNIRSVWSLPERYRQSKTTRINRMMTWLREKLRTSISTCP